MLSWIILMLFSFIPPVVYVIWIRNTERYHPEPWVAVFTAFVWGGTLAIVASLFLEILLNISLATTIKEYSLLIFMLVVVVAPVVEEFTKPLAMGLQIVRRELQELEDGLIYGAAAGLGFSATENLFYAHGFWDEGWMVFIVLISLRTIGACLLHASATAMTGYGIGKAFIHRRPLMVVLPYFALAIGAHALYNFLASFSLFGTAVGVGAAILFSLAAIKYVRDRIRKLDADDNMFEHP
jgi:RsiW-degrading membrane proteinase PrsW (M82 family)